MHDQVEIWIADLANAKKDDVGFHKLFEQVFIPILSIEAIKTS